MEAICHLLFYTTFCLYSLFTYFNYNVTKLIGGNCVNETSHSETHYLLCDVWFVRSYFIVYFYFFISVIFTIW